MKTLLTLAAAAALPLCAAASGTHEVHGPADAYVYELAAPGTYSLPVIREAPEARLLDETGAERSLAALFEGRITVLAFMYTRCGDVCPMAAGRMADLQAIAADDGEVASALRLVSLSFDPAHDRPDVIADYAASLRVDDPGAPPWTFLTAARAERAAIAPVLEGYGQPVARKRDPDDPTGPFSHLLRVFLIDGQGRIRNIYSADFLDPRLVMNDVRTLLMSAASTQ
ncbi:MAG: SCO family protein [Pseudomonadota bacterium]